MLQSFKKRLSHFFDDRIRSTQYGFRASRSTTQPVRIMRRVLEIFERQQNWLHLLFLDWSKAFDSVSFSASESSLTHFGAPSLFVRTIMSLYSSPKFVVRDSGSCSEVSPQTRGLRQSSFPLSFQFCSLASVFSRGAIVHLTIWSSLRCHQHAVPFLGLRIRR